MKSILTCMMLLLSLTAFSQSAPGTGYGELSHPVALLLLAVAVGLLLAIIILGYTVLSAMDIYRERMKKLPFILLLLAVSQTASAQSGSIVSGLSDNVFYMLLSVIALELVVMLFLLQALRVLTGISRRRKPKKAKAAKPRISWMEKLNRTRSVDAAGEAEADMGHDYDGIRELNNPTPPWWRWGFYFSMVFAVVYLWRYHVTHAAPLQLEELDIANRKAAVAKEEYLKNAANNIDEHSVKLITDAAELDAARKVFSASCAACHGPEGQGLVGPNLTDPYWLHGGKVNDIFSTIKYGVPDKGMKSWKDDLSPKQIAQLTGFIRSLQGTNPANPKAAEGQKE